MDELESCYSQLAEEGQATPISITHIDELVDKLPVQTSELRNIADDDLDVSIRVHPLSSFMKFMEGRCSAVARLAERLAYKSEISSTKEQNPHVHSKLSNKNTKSTALQASSLGQASAIAISDKQCLVHDESKHTTDTCKVFTEMSIDDKYTLLKSNKLVL